MTALYLVVEAMCDLVADHEADGAVVHVGGPLGVEEDSAEDAWTNQSSVLPHCDQSEESTVRPSKSGSKSCQTWPFLFSKYGYQELVCTRTSGWLYPCVNIHMVIAW